MDRTSFQDWGDNVFTFRFDAYFKPYALPGAYCCHQDRNDRLKFSLSGQLD